MKHLLILGSLFFLIACTSDKESNSFILSGKVGSETSYVLYNSDTINVHNNEFMDTIQAESGRYEYIQLSDWKWPKLIYTEKNKHLDIDFSQATIQVSNDKLNTFLLHIDSLLIPYSLRWNMEEEVFRNAIHSELQTNHRRIDSIFSNTTISQEQILELKQIEKLKVGHRTANFISFQEKEGKEINRNIYDFLGDIDLNNKRLENQVNNRNFQYYFLLDKVSDELPDAIYPFAAIDTVNAYSDIESIRKMIITSIVKSAFYNENVNQDSLLMAYENNFGKLEEGSELLLIYDKVQSLKPGKLAPSIGELKNLNGDIVTIEDLRGKSILITVWGTWCPYCKEELPHLKNLINKYGDTFESVGISLDKDQSKWKSYIKENDWKGIHLLDSARKSTFKTNYLVGGTNIHVLINKDGVIMSSKSLKPSSKELEELIKNLN